MNEKNIDHGIDKNMNLERDIRNAEIIFKNPGKKRIQEDDFKDIFDEKEIESDKTFINRVQDKFASQLEQFDGEELKKIHEGEKRSEVLEIIIASDGERYHWTGKNTRFSLTAKFDDIVNGIDILLEFFEETTGGQNNIDKIALGVDASRSTDTYTLARKIERNVEKLLNKNGKKLPELKYYKSAVNENIKGSLTAVIPVVIGLDTKHVNELMRLCATSRGFRNPKTQQEYKEMGIDYERRQNEVEEKLLKHPAQIVFYRQITAQLVYYLKLLKNENRPNNSLIKQCEQEINSILKKLEKIKETKRNIPIDDYASDEVLKTIEGITSKPL